MRLFTADVGDFCENKKQVSAAAYRLAEYAARAVWGTCPEIVRPPAGRPYFASEGRFFSLSHTGERVLVGVSDRELGVDVEKRRAVSAGLVVLPKKIRQAVMEAKYTTDHSSSGFMQRAMEYYLRENGWETHGEQMRRYGGAKYRKALSAARKYLDGLVRYGKPEGGVSLWMELPEGVGAETFCGRMLEKNVVLTPGSQYEISGEDDRHIRLSFAGLSDDKIDVGMKRMGDTLREMGRG